jgi:hypothetical protein
MYQNEDGYMSVIAMSYGLNGWGSIRRPRKSFLFYIVSRSVLGLTQPPIQWVPGALPLKLKRQIHEIDHSLSSSAEVRKV